MAEMYNQIFTKGLQSKLDTIEIESGKVRVATDTKRLFIDNDNERIEITDFVKGMTEEEVRATLAPLPKLYLTSDTHKLMIFTSDNEWLVCGETTVSHADTADNATNDSDGNAINTTYLKIADMEAVSETETDAMM